MKYLRSTDGSTGVIDSIKHLSKYLLIVFGHDIGWYFIVSKDATQSIGCVKIFLLKVV